MEKYSEYIKQTLDAYKCSNKYDELRCIPVYNEQEDLVAFLRPITFDYKMTIKECIHLLSKWRAENMEISNAKFEVTDERTEKWLEELILQRADRLLFLIIMVEGNAVGHIGYSNFTYETKTAEVDSVLRGDKNAMKGIMTFALRSLIQFGYARLKLENIQLTTAFGRETSTSLYERTGFEIIKKMPLRALNDEEDRWVIDESLGQNAEKFDVLMQHCREKKG